MHLVLGKNIDARFNYNAGGLRLAKAVHSSTTDIKTSMEVVGVVELPYAAFNPTMFTNFNTHMKIDSLSSTEAGTRNGNAYILCRRYFFSRLQFLDSFTEVYTKLAPSSIEGQGLHVICC